MSESKVIDRPMSQIPASPKSSKKPYRKPELVVHGDVARITGTQVKIGLGDGRTPVGGLYRNS